MLFWSRFSRTAKQILLRIETNRRGINNSKILNGLCDVTQIAEVYIANKLANFDKMLDHDFKQNMCQ